MVEEAQDLIRSAWRPNNNHDLIAIKLSTVLSLLAAVGYDIHPFIREWRASYEVYEIDGGRARFRPLKTVRWQR